ncbi:nucleotide-diphospho-sugar transferase [Pseudovirgaria hyperparasitica]|uniref:Nucleotide-diphospho-sugar transferase n=1 Tax=Pseudovirgaria hyperparasitica TaxID=470096 RepID=A0A6A6W4V3_9PEZI|nr:nucleotide-diphospho-sugar transferase [Pseudovirgaria hyperparasitica]KAF2756986.1 nucleotide-diphospho-sugar transferase [Pseudovirgaria hyperparasitica]
MISIDRRRSAIVAIFLVITFCILSWTRSSAFRSAPPLDPNYGKLSAIDQDSKFAILLHDNDTKRRNSSIPFIVLVSARVDQEKRARLEKDGAQVVEVEDVPTAWWVRTYVTRWADQFTKLRVLEWTQYDRILFVDADTLLTRPLDGIFQEPEAHQPVDTLHTPSRKPKADEAQLPAQYLFGARSDNAFTGERAHPFPPLQTPNFSAGFWLVAPSKELYAYLMSVMQHYHRFDPETMEQSLLNYAFRREGPMPWRELDYKWSATWPNQKDVQGEVKSLHEKFWTAGPKELRQMWKVKHNEMETWWRRWDKK